MIHVTRLNGEGVVLNAELIETVESTPDTIITLTTGKRMVVREDLEEVMRLVIAYRQSAYGHRPVNAPGRGAGEDEV